MKKTNLTLSIALAAVFSSSVAFAEAEVTGKFVHESAQLSSGANTGIKSESTVRVYIDGEAEGIAEGATYHVELQGYDDGKANHSSSAAYTQRDPLREAYIDMQQGDWSIRAGKQQVVWGTADGMKLLDMINPTDYVEMAQNQMEDSRIPVWMVNAEKDNLQVVVSQAKENVFAGLNRGTDTSVRANNADGSDKVYVGNDTDSAFLMMGPESITGKTNGFLNITPDLGSVAGGFGGNFMPLGAAPDELGGLKGMAMNGQGGMVDGMSDLLASFTVDAFTIKRDPTTQAVILDTDGIAKSSTINELNSAFVGMQLGKATATFIDTNGAQGYNPANLTGNDQADATAFIANYVFPNGSTDPYGNSIAGDSMVGQFSDMNFIGAIVGMACNDPNYGDFNGQINCAASPYYNADGTANADQTGWLATEAEINAYAASVKADFDKDIVIDAGGNTMKLGDMFTGEAVLNGFGAMFGTNLASFGDGNANSAFEYMTNTGFRTFDTYVNARSQYKYSMPSDSDVNIAFRTQESTADGVNYSLNYSYNYDTNPIIDLSWRNGAGEVLTQAVVDAPLTMMVGQSTDGTPIMNTIDSTYLELRDSTYNSATGAGVYGGATGKSAILTFEQQVKRVHNFGGSFDTSIETAELGPVVIRGEALYTKDGYSPVMSKTKLSVGDLVGALQMKKADRFKFVLGADITAMTNMLVSAQFIQDSNLDFVDNGDEYTTDYATMHLSNGFNKGTKDKNFYSLFFSKPFGESGQHRWNNITMYEEGNGNWNRFDIDYSIDDDTQATLEYNKYWGDANTQFGQLEKSSNIQVGVKYSF